MSRTVKSSDAPIPRLADLDDAALVAATLDGRREAFDEIVERHRRVVYQLCYRFVNQPEDAADLTQETFVRAWRGLAKFRGQAALSTWLHRIAVNVCLNRVALKRLPTEPIDDRQFVDPGARDPHGDLVRDERAARVRAAIAQLPPKQRATLLLRVYQDMPHEEIAQVLGNTVGAVKANFFHALGNLRRLLGEQP
ncbi:MAG: RNA polymerase sigma factor [Vicinamibacterales bacterium]|nr:RNA polymerase sigma factor [Vicinamibacterales bacterium]